MLAEYDFQTKQEAQDAAFNLLTKENDSHGLPRLMYMISAIRSLKIADSFKEKPVTPFDIPRETDEGEAKEYVWIGIDEQTGKETGGRAYIFQTEHYYPEEHTCYDIVVLSPDEVDPSNYTIPFRNLQENLLPIIARRGITFIKPKRAITPKEARTPEGQECILKLLRSYEIDAFFTYDREEYKDGLSKEKFFDIEDDEIEENPEEWEDDWEDNVRFINCIAPSLLSELTGRKVTNAKGYASALETLLGSTLDKRERKAATGYYDFALRDLFLSYATYEFFRTEDYSHLQEILSLYADFGLPENWQKDFILLSYWETIKGKQKLKTFSAEEAIVSKYLSNEYSTLLSPFSLRDISEGTGIPMSIIYKATKLRKWD